VPGFRPRFFVVWPETSSPLVVSPWSETDPFAPGAELRGVEVRLTAEDSRHALRVLRLSEGDECEVVVGWSAGAAVYAAAVSAMTDPVRVRLISRLEGEAAGAYYRTQVGLVQALTRPAVMDYVLEKATEVGASFFILVQAEGSPKRSDLSRGDRLDRWRRIAREAAKQSKQMVVPSVVTAGSIGQALEESRTSHAYSLVLEPGAASGLQDVLARNATQAARVALWVGPEGGWAAGELDQFAGAGVGTARLGRSVLRTETAGSVAVAVARLVLGDW
jgi:16S rRNA (uracil1498-N3)-methyltransferase